MVTIQKLCFYLLGVAVWIRSLVIRICIGSRPPSYLDGTVYVLSFPSSSRQVLSRIYGFLTYVALLHPESVLAIPQLSNNNACIVMVVGGCIVEGMRQ